MKKAKDAETGTIHWVTSKKWRELFYICLCGKVSGLVWTKADKEEVTCRKCLSIKRK